MKKLKRAMLLLSFVLLMVLASVGMGIAGAVPVVSTNKRKDAIVIDVEEVDAEDAETDLSLLEIQKI
jgi:hypothetical protein